MMSVPPPLMFVLVGGMFVCCKYGRHCSNISSSEAGETHPTSLKLPPWHWESFVPARILQPQHHICSCGGEGMPDKSPNMPDSEGIMPEGGVIWEPVRPAITSIGFPKKGRGPHITFPMCPHSRPPQNSPHPLPEADTTLPQQGTPPSSRVWHHSPPEAGTTLSQEGTPPSSRV